MKMCSSGVGLMVAVTCSCFLSNSAFGQRFSQGFSRTSGSAISETFGSGGVRGNDLPKQGDRYEKAPQTGTGFQQQSSTSVSGSRSVSFTKNGMRVTIRESASGITVTVNGQQFQAKNAAELKRKFPDAYRLYDQHIGAAQFRGSARAFGNGAGAAGDSSNGARGMGLPGQSESSSGQNRSISVMENGEKISITENKSGILVSGHGKRVKAKDAAELKKKSPEAYRIYEKHLGEPAAAGGGAVAGGGGRAEAGFNGNPGSPEATRLLRKELEKLREENAGNPQMRDLIERMMQSVGKE